MASAIFGLPIEAAAQTCGPGAQIGPNPNPLGNTITITLGTANCNSTITAPNVFQNDGTVRVQSVPSTPAGLPNSEFANFFGSFNNRASGSLLENNGGQISNIQGTITSSGTVRNQAGGALFNFQGSTIISDGLFVNSAATVSNLGSFTSGTSLFGSTLRNEAAATFLNFNGASLTTRGTVENLGGRIDNLTGGFWNHNAGTIN